MRDIHAPEEIVNEFRVVAVELLDPERGVVWPEIVFKVVHTPERSFSTNHDTWGQYLYRVVETLQAATRHDRNHAGVLLLFCYVESALEDQLIADGSVHPPLAALAEDRF